MTYVYVNEAQPAPQPAFDYNGPYNVTITPADTAVEGAVHSYVSGGQRYSYTPLPKPVDPSATAERMVRARGRDEDDTFGAVYQASDSSSEVVYASGRTFNPRLVKKRKVKY
ncbi:hypothetical protein AGDE_13189 [Angomonas deanei]|uniref:Uncharacterized protein n=1 Tax=Angomonas deanei TaxID=59799 RepID=A0A7G2CNH9_9TRYP|nr:hypothetical protein AGDE_13189 [Angomonas deanei]CAD2221408.1 hypothetical protein, conserved [Angomonas deanei]|eukprot:EPY22570.1 hypothetical protein AGDE_13189 [Angomonas deanei]